MSVIVVNISVVLGLIVLIGVPVLVLALIPIVRPLQRRQRAQREALGKLTSLGADTVVGLRVLRGVVPVHPGEALGVAQLPPDVRQVEPRHVVDRDADRDRMQRLRCCPNKRPAAPSTRFVARSLQAKVAGA